jgi:hypothetical protein
MSAKNLITRSVAPKSLFADATALHSAAVSYNQGDLLILDTSGHLIAKPAAEADGATFLGIAIESVSAGVLVTPYTLASSVAPGASVLAGPQYGVIAKLTLKTGQSISPGNVVYLDPASGTQNVQVTGTKSIGVYQGAAISGAAAGTQIEVLLGCRAPADTLTF